MKLIIDIYEDDYKQLKDYPSVWNSHYERIIANGTPYNPTGDLISRSELIQGMMYKLGLHDEENGSEPLYMEALVDVENLIKETPPVAVNCKECDGYEAGYSAGLNDAERPKR